MIDLEKISESVWIDYADDEKYLIKYVTDDQIRTLANRKDIALSTYEASKDTPKDEDDLEAKTDTFLRDLLAVVLSNRVAVEIACIAVEKWEGIKSSGKDLPCTDENKHLVFEKFETRAMWIFRQARNEKNWKMGQVKKDLKN